MNISNTIGSFGVTLLLIAFLLNLFRYISQESKIYIFLNILGAGLSCYASFLISYWPFVVLEATWCGVAVIALVRKKKAGLE
jgi:uncharacterized membrane protein required for colicin V production